MWGNSIIWPVVSGTMGPNGGFSKGLWVPWDTGTMGNQTSVSIRVFTPLKWFSELFESLWRNQYKSGGLHILEGMIAFLCY